MAGVPQQVINGLSSGAVYALFALGFTLVFGVLDLLNLAHGANYMWGAFAGWVLVTRAGLPILLALPAAMLVAGVIAVLLDRLAFKPLRALSPGTGVLWAGFLLLLLVLVISWPRALRLMLGAAGVLLMIAGIGMDERGVGPVRERQVPHLSPMISSIGASIILVSLAQGIFGSQQSRFPPTAFPQTRFRLGAGISVSLLQITILICAIMLMIVLRWLIARTRMGRAIRAIAWNERTSRLLGVDVDRVIAQTFFISGALAGAAGVLFGLLYASVRPDMGARIEIIGLTVIIVGGMGSIAGAITGGFLIGLIQTFSVALVQSNFRDAIVFLLLLIVLLVRPSGIFGRAASTRA
ncbi:MAG TPA: branched-chain amino acid ABC transporter permease [Herpetosiphonaceae bacterium]|nr:branched-chain amino acid ABC transporter permease [Herpetosiphonaceae bacterium]